MAANMQHMAGGPMLAQQQAQRRAMGNANQDIAAVVSQSLMNQPPIMNGWQTTLSIQDRLGKIMNL